MKSREAVAADFTKTGGMDRANYAFAGSFAIRGVDAHLTANRVSSNLPANGPITFHLAPKLLDPHTAADRLLNRFRHARAARTETLGRRVIDDATATAHRGTRTGLVTCTKVTRRGRCRHADSDAETQGALVSRREPRAARLSVVSKSAWSGVAFW